MTPPHAGRIDATRDGGRPLREADERAVRDPDDEDLGGLIVAPTQPRHGLVLVRVIGEIDMLTAGHLGEVLDGALATVADDRDAGGDGTGPRPTPTVVCDLADVTFLGASGLDAFVAAHRNALVRDVRLVLVAEHRTVVRPIRLTALDRRLTLMASHPDLGRGAPAGPVMR